MKKLVIIGAGGHGKVVADIAKKNNYKEIIFLDDAVEINNSLHIPVKGNTSDIDNYKEWDFFVAIGNSETRKNIINKLLNKGLKLVTLVHPQAVISENVTIGKGTVVMAGAVINADTVIGDGCIVNTCASVDHDCKIGDYVHVSVGAHIAGTVNVCNMTQISIGATIINNIDVCENVVIGAGSVVIKDINEAGKYVGVPAKKIK